MKRLLALLLLCILTCKGNSQEVSFYLHITDKGRIIAYNEEVPVFDDPNINDIFANYTVMHFAKAFPQSGYEHLRKVYKITGNSVGLAQELVSYDSLMFPAFEEIYNPVPLGSFYPNDWNQDWPNDTLQFAFINAHKAWDISKGDTNTIIGITDTI